MDDSRVPSVQEVEKLLENHVEAHGDGSEHSSHTSIPTSPGAALLLPNIPPVGLPSSLSSSALKQDGADALPVIPEGLENAQTVNKGGVSGI